MIALEQGILYSLLLGMLIGIIWGARRRIMLERIILNADYNIKKIVEKIEKEELKIEKKLKIK